MIVGTYFKIDGLWPSPPGHQVRQGFGDLPGFFMIPLAVP